MTRPVRTHDEQTAALARYMPLGKIWRAFRATGTTSRAFIAGLALEMVRIDETIRRLEAEVLPDQTEAYIAEWERAVGIPDEYGCLKGLGSVANRRRDVLIKLASMGLQTAADFVALAKQFGIVVSIKGGAYYSTTLLANEPTIVFADDRTARHTIVVEYGTDEGNVFPFVDRFPIPFGSTNLALLQCIFERTKPATCDVIFRRNVGA